MKMKLELLLKKITPLPWNKAIPARNVTQLQENNKIYAHHVANVLPELVTAFENIMADSSCSAYIAQTCEEALARAEEVKP
jgi:hypothetical protein